MNGKTVIFGVVCMYIGFRMGVKTTCDRVVEFLNKERERLEKERDKDRPDYYSKYKPFPGEEINKNEIS